MRDPSSEDADHRRCPSAQSLPEFDDAGRKWVQKESLDLDEEASRLFDLCDPSLEGQILGIAMQSLSDIGGPAVFDCFRYLLADSGWRHSDVYANVMCV
jgi:hypothetical protein